ncbi:LLM class flavin-dependent oxidoreductase [Inquilinus limosus]|uniref:LLM class flavin-dependent oxidoreductase n=1 Tax=Inquilinus limosus TaxID=171674 RepID=UPI003F178017
MSETKREMKLGLFLQPLGHHVAGWRHPEAQAVEQDLALIQRIARTAEDARFDMVFLADGLTTGRDAHPSWVVRFEPLTLLAALAMTTTRIGLAATASTTYGDPFTTARAFASLDHLSQGRAAWNVVTTSYDRSASNFSREQHLEHDLRYEVAEEFVEVAKGLWDSWDEDAFPKDKDSGVFFDTSKFHELNHKGRFFSVKGPLNVARAPQGHPVLIQAGSSGVGQDFAAKIAEVVFTAQFGTDEARAFYRGLKERVAAQGRRPDQVHIMPGVMPVIGRTTQEAKDKYAKLQRWSDDSNALFLLSERLGHDISGYPLDGPLPELPPSNQNRSRAELLTRLAREQNLTIRELYHLVASARGHRIVWGTAEEVADALQDWFTGGAADGFNIMPAYFPGAFEEFTGQVVPILQDRGLFRRDYQGTTLRDHLGLPYPKSRWAA